MRFVAILPGRRRSELNGSPRCCFCIYIRQNVKGSEKMLLSNGNPYERDMNAQERLQVAIRFQNNVVFERIIVVNEILNVLIVLFCCYWIPSPIRVSNAVFCIHIICIEEILSTIEQFDRNRNSICRHLILHIRNERRCSMLAMWIHSFWRKCDICNIVSPNLPSSAPSQR